MSNVGILVFKKTKSRGGARTCDIVAAPPVTIGFAQIINECSIKHNIKYVDIADASCEFVLASLVSWTDVYNLIIALRGKKPRYKLIIGGPGVVNIYPLMSIAWAACFGRGEGLINKIIEHDTSLPNVWFSDDAECKKYTIGQPKQQIKGYYETEQVCGCPRKCFFCEYGWKYKYLPFGKQYSEYRNLETMFQDIDWTRGAATAGLDGLTQAERWVVNKPLSQYKIVETLGRHVHRDNFRLKLFCVVAYPFGEGYDLEEWEETINIASKIVKKPITIMLSFSHFCPMPLTPMEEESIMMVDRKQVPPVKIGKIKYMTYLQGTTYASAVYESLLYRAKKTDDTTSFVLSNTPSGAAAWIIADKFPHIVSGGYIPADNVIRPHDVDSGKKEYKKRVSIYKAGGSEMVYLSDKSFYRFGKRNKSSTPKNGKIIGKYESGLLLVETKDGKKEVISESDILSGIEELQQISLVCRQKEKQKLDKSQLSLFS